MSGVKGEKLAQALGEISWRHMDEALKIRNGEVKRKTVRSHWLRYADIAAVLLCVSVLLLAATVQLVKNAAGDNPGGSGSDEMIPVTEEHSAADSSSENDETVSDMSEDWMELAWKEFNDLQTKKEKEGLWAYTGFADAVESYGKLCPAADYDGDGTTDRIYVHEGHAYLFFGSRKTLYLGDVTVCYEMEARGRDLTGDGVNEVLFVGRQDSADSGAYAYLVIFEMSEGTWKALEYPGLSLISWQDEDRILFFQPDTGFCAEADLELLVKEGDFGSVTVSSVPQETVLKTGGIQISEKNGVISIYMSSSFGNRWYSTLVYWCVTYDGEWRISDLFMPEARVLEKGGILAGGFAFHCDEREGVYQIMGAVYQCIMSFKDNFQGQLLRVTYAPSSDDSGINCSMAILALIDQEERQLTCFMHWNDQELQYEIDGWGEDKMN